MALAQDRESDLFAGLLARTGVMPDERVAEAIDAGGADFVAVLEAGRRGVFGHNHTLPINWNKKQADPATQKYTCGDNGFRRAHIAASSYHAGGVNVCLADGSVRFVRETVEFALWQNAGTRANGEVTTAFN